MNQMKTMWAELDGLFTDKEAWDLFRLAAFVETVTWTLLIIGILFKKFLLPGYEFVLPIAGSLHGVCFLAYIVIVFFVHRSLKWSIRRLIVAEAVSNVPYGAMLFEIWVAKKR